MYWFVKCLAARNESATGIEKDMKRLTLVWVGVLLQACGTESDAGPTTQPTVVQPSNTNGPGGTTPNPTTVAPSPSVQPSSPGAIPSGSVTPNSTTNAGTTSEPATPTTGTSSSNTATSSSPGTSTVSETSSPTGPTSTDTDTPTSESSEPTSASESTGPTEPNQPAGCGNAVVCDDFESGMSSAWVVQPNSTPAPSVDTTKGANGSAASLKVLGTSQQSFVAVPVPAQSFFFRAYMNFEQSTEQMNGHGWFVVGADNVTQGDEQQMRFGSSGNHGHKEIDFNVYGNSCSGEKTQFSDGASDGAAGWNNTQYPSYKFNAGTWYCVEGHFNGPANEFQLWIDDTEVPGLHVTAASMCANWSPTYTHVKFGAGANSDIGAIWYDDIAVSTERIGCK